MDELDAYRCARIFIDRHGEDAAIHAAMRADELDAARDAAGRSAWVAILAAIDELGRTVKSPSEPLQ